MTITLKDVAEKAGVSLATASLALNNSDKVKEETYQRVHKIAEELNYIPNARAQALVKKSTRTIGLVIPEVINPFFAELAQAIKNSVKAQDYNLILCSTDYKTDEERRYINMFKTGQVDGAIFACVGDLMKKNNELIKDLVLNHTPVVYVDREGVDNDLIPIIRSNLEDGAYQATKYLIESGHRKIGFIGQSYERMKGYKKAVNSNDLKMNEDYIFYDYLTIEGGYKVGKKILGLKDRPTAVVSLNDEMAIGLIQALTAGGMKIPADISVCGTDNIRISNFYNPPLTTVNIPIKKMGHKAAKILLKLINGEQLTAEEKYVVYPTDLIIRESTRKI